MPELMNQREVAKAADLQSTVCCNIIEISVGRCRWSGCRVEYRVVHILTNWPRRSMEQMRNKRSVDWA